MPYKCLDCACGVHIRNHLVKIINQSQKSSREFGVGFRDEQIYFFFKVHTKLYMILKKPGAVYCM